MVFRYFVWTFPFYKSYSYVTMLCNKSLSRTLLPNKSELCSLLLLPFMFLLELCPGSGVWCCTFTHQSSLRNREMIGGLGPTCINMYTTLYLSSLPHTPTSHTHKLQALQLPNLPIEHHCLLPQNTIQPPSTPSAAS